MLCKKNFRPEALIESPDVGSTVEVNVGLLYGDRQSWVSTQKSRDLDCGLPLACKTRFIVMRQQYDSVRQVLLLEEPLTVRLEKKDDMETSVRRVLVVPCRFRVNGTNGPDSRRARMCGEVCKVLDDNGDGGSERRFGCRSRQR